FLARLFLSRPALQPEPLGQPSPPQLSGHGRSHPQLPPLQTPVPGIVLLPLLHPDIRAQRPVQIQLQQAEQRALVLLDDQEVVPPFSTIVRAVSCWQCMASAVTTRPSRSRASSTWGMAPISLLCSATACCPSVRPRR